MNAAEAQEVVQQFHRNLLEHNYAEAGAALQRLMGEPDGAAQVAHMIGLLLSGMQRGSIRRALTWVLALPGASTVLVDVKAGLARVEAGADLEQGN